MAILNGYELPLWNADGTLCDCSFIGWEDLRFPANQLRINPATTKPDADTTIGGLLFAHDSTETVTAIAQLPHAWDEGSVLKPHVHWTKTSSASGGVYWQLAYRWAPIGEVFDADWTTIGSATADVSDGNTANQHALTVLADITATGKQISDCLILQLSRVHDNAADNYGADARLLEFDIHYRVNSFGSVTGEFTK